MGLIKTFLIENRYRKAYKRNLTVFIQGALYIFYFWAGLVSLMQTASLREIQRIPHSEDLPSNDLFYGVLYISIAVAAMILLVIIAAKNRLVTKHLLQVNIILPCVIMLLRFFMSAGTYMMIPDELVYWRYIVLNEIVFYSLNAVFIACSAYFFIKQKSTSRRS